MAGKGQETPGYIKQILPHGFESFEINFWMTLGKCDLKKLARETLEVLDGTDAVVSCLGIYGNPLKKDAEGKEARDGWKALIDACKLFKTDMVCGFAGRVVGEPIDKSIDRWVQVFEPLAKRAADKGVRIAFENCEMGGNWKSGDWNIAQTPAAWELMFKALPMKNIGLEWEPCHQMVKLIDPMPQLRKWVKKVFHIHGKDATILWDVVKEYGVNGPKPFAFHRTPGFGDSNWTDIISELRRGGFEGSIDIEGWHDPVYRNDLEMTGQVHGLKYLKWCRGGDLIQNPV
jgi:sugar phosphate isomerase/epimerase